MKKQKALMIQDMVDVNLLNSYISKCWVVVHTCPMPSSLAMAGGGESSMTSDLRINPTCLVIIEEGNHVWLESKKVIEGEEK